jgi:heat shock protein HslJ
MKRHPAIRGFAAVLALASIGACTTPVTMPWDERKPALTGSVWRWTETLMSDDTRIRPAAPERYSLEFLPDGATRVRADCNTGSGRYETAADRQLTLGRLAVTQAACLPGSLGDAYLKGLANVSGYLFDGDNLVLMLKYDSGTMRFVALKR